MTSQEKILNQNFCKKLLEVFQSWLPYDFITMANEIICDHFFQKLLMKIISEDT